MNSIARLKYVLSVFESCETIDQWDSTLLWFERIKDKLPENSLDKIKEVYKASKFY